MIKRKPAFKVLTERFKVTFSRKSPNFEPKFGTSRHPKTPLLFFLLTTPSVMPVSHTKCKLQNNSSDIFDMSYCILGPRPT